MQLIPYLAFNGECRAAFELYEKCLGGKIAFSMTWGEAPNSADHDPAMRDRIMHISLRVDGFTLAGADAPPNLYRRPEGLCVSINVADPAQAERIFNALAEGGSVEMPIEETFWAARFGVLRDRFGIPWMVNCERPR
jgi:PhnB protein